MARVTRKQLIKQDEFVESAVDVGQWLEENWRTLVKWVAAALAVVIVVVAGLAWVERGRQQAREKMNAAVAAFREAESAGFTSDQPMDKILGDLESAVSDAGNSVTAQLGRYYQAATLHRMGRDSDAVPLLEQVVASPKSTATLAGSAQSLLVTALVGAGEVDRAIERLQQMVEQPQVGVPVEQSLIRLAKLYRSQGRTDEARAALQRVTEEFGQTAASFEASQLLEGLAAGD